MTERTCGERSCASDIFALVLEEVQYSLKQISSAAQVPMAVSHTQRPLAYDTDE